MEDYIITYKTNKIERSEVIKISTSFDSWAQFTYLTTAEQFQNYLKNVNASISTIQLSSLVNWEEILSRFNIEFHNHWNSLAFPKEFDLSNNQKVNFRQELYRFCTPNLFYSSFGILNRQSSKKMNTIQLQNELYDIICIVVINLFKPFNFQSHLLSLEYKNDPQIIAPKIHKLKKDAERGQKFNPGKKYRTDEVPVYEHILTLKEGRYKNLSLKQISTQIAEEKLNYTNYHDLENFYRRLLKYKNNKKT